ncbi:MAG: hypothetical protein FWC94_03915 [Bacteroidales bacterium]|nr:hypothetical protein [Bacteroidales bacterium]
METYVKFAGSEPTGAGMILLLSLAGAVILYLAFKRYRNKSIDVKNHSAKPAIPSNVMAGTPELAAIAAVIHLYKNELHDEEITIMTINKIARAYSPWSAKHQFLNQYFNLRRR